MKLKSLLAFPLALFTLSVFSQAVTTRYFKSRMDEGTQADCSFYQVMKDTLHDGDTVKTFFCANNSIRSVAVVNSKGEYNGIVVFYHSNGKQKSRVTFRDGIPDGPAKSWYPNGNMQSMELYRVSVPFQPVIMHYWDSTGVQRITGGTGVAEIIYAPWSEPNQYWVGKMKSGVKDSVWTMYGLSGTKVLEETYIEGALVEGSRRHYDDGTVYTVIEEPARPVGGMTAFYETVGKNLKYPLDARKKNIQGRVFVQFVINIDGSLTDIHVIKGIGFGCDEEAVRAVSKTQWIPGQQRGKPVRQMMVLPIMFKISP